MKITYKFRTEYGDERFLSSRFAKDSFICADGLWHFAPHLRGSPTAMQTVTFDVLKERPVGKRGWKKIVVYRFEQGAWKISYRNIIGRTNEQDLHWKLAETLAQKFTGKKTTKKLTLYVKVS